MRLIASKLCVDGKSNRFTAHQRGMPRLEASAHRESANDTPEHPYPGGRPPLQGHEMDFRPKAGWHREKFAPADGTEVIFFKKTQSRKESLIC